MPRKTLPWGKRGDCDFIDYIIIIDTEVYKTN